MLHHKKLIISGIGGLILVLISIWFWFEWAAKPGQTGGTTTTVATLFPTGELRPGITKPNTATSSPSLGAEGEVVTDRSGRFFRVTSQPVGGALLIGRGTSSVLVYVERATGHLYRLSPDAVGAERISNTTIPKVYRLFGGQNNPPDGRAGTSTQIIFQYLNGRQLQTFSGGLDVSSSTVGDAFLKTGGNLTPLAGRLLSLNTTELAVAPFQNKFFWLEKVGNETLGYTADLSGNRKELVFRSPHLEWLPAWATSTILALQTSPSAQTAGVLYFLNTNTKELTPIINSVLGLTTKVSPRLDQIFYSGQTDRGVVSGFYDVKKRFFGRLNIQTWSDKCVWDNAGTFIYCAVPNSLPTEHWYPDDWYRGEVELSDNIWKIDASSQQAEIIYSPSQGNSNLELDAEYLLLDDQRNTLYFFNRRDQQLWALNLLEHFSTGG